jgi:hypothetical protein
MTPTELVKEMQKIQTLIVTPTKPKEVKHKTSELFK